MNSNNTDEKGRRGDDDRGDARQDDDHGRGGDQGHKVAITINDTKFELKPGVYTGLELKQLGGFPSAFVLERVPKLDEVRDDERVHIKGGEHFVCHERVGQAS